MIDVSDYVQSHIDVEKTARIKYYPDGSYEVMAATLPLWREDGWESRKKASAVDSAALCCASSSAKREAPLAENLDRSLRRARSALRDKALCTSMRYFVTLTLSPQKVGDRHDIAALTKLLRVWLDNRVRRCGLAYVLVPERHKDGALHLHGLFTEGLDLVDSGTIKPCGGSRPKKPRSKRERERLIAGGGQIVYNIQDWHYGFSTAIELSGDYAAAVGYVCKYISKDSEKIGGRWYFSGGNLGKPSVTYCNICYDEVAASVDSYVTSIQPCEGWGFGLAIKRGKGEVWLGRSERRDL